MEAVAVQRKPSDKAVKAATAAVSENQSPAGAETGAMAGMPLFMQGGASGKNSAAPLPASRTTAPAVQRACAACAQQLDDRELLLQPALTIGPVNDPLEREADAVAERVMRQAGGTTMQAHGPSIQRLCKPCAARREEPPLPGVQRKDDGSEGSAGAGDMATDSVRRLIASPGTGHPLSGPVRDQAEPVLQADLSGVRVHSSARAQQAAAAIDARAFTYQNHIFLGAGQSDTDLGLMAHELTHTVQQGSSPALSRIQRFELPSVDDIVGGLEDAGEAIGDAAESAWEAGEELAEEAWETGEELVEGAGELAEEAVDALHGIAREVWDTATAIASAIGGMVSLSGTRLVITVPAFDACPVIALQFTLPAQETFIPIVEGAIPVHPSVAIYGAVGINATMTPELSAQLGPCRVHGLRLVIDPLGGSYSAAGWVTVTTALGLGAEASVGARGEVGAIVIIPTVPPIPIPISVVGLEAGIAAQVRAIAAATVDLQVAASYSGGTFSGALRAENDIGLGLDWGVGGYGQLDVLGINLCRLYWPLYEDHWDSGLHYEVDAAVRIGVGGFSASLGIGGFRPVPFSSFPLQLDRDVLADDCVLIDALCAILYRLGQMPSQNGGAWTGHPEPYWPGPLDIYPRAPAIGSGAKCRGACGPDCDTCSLPEDLVHCEPRPTADGGEGHDLWIYPNYQECDSHQGCRDHDACYDWCGAGGPGGLEPFLCRRLCDFECACAYPPHQCVGWIFGGEPHDSGMDFSDAPYVSGGCDIPCPREGGGEGEGSGGYTACMPRLKLFDQLSDGDAWNVETEEYPVWRKDIVVPYVGLVTLELTARGKAKAEVEGSLGPGTMENICFDVNPTAGTYVARGEILIPARLSGALSLSASLKADASWFLIVEVASATGTLEATAEATGTASLNPTLSAQVVVGCDGGLKPSITSDFRIPHCLRLAFDLNAGFDLEALTFNIYSNRWNLIHAEWGRCWGEDADIDAHPGREPDLDLRSHEISIPDLIRWLLSDEAEEGDAEPETTRTVVEDPLTTATAKTIPSLNSDLNRTTYNSTTLSLLDGSSATVGDSMMTRYLTHEKTGGGPPSGQGALYGFRKLPTKSAFGGSGYGLNQVYIRGHLLNDGLGGVGQPRNLYPITGRANKDHELGPEQEVKDLVRNAPNLVVMYGVNTVNQDGPHAVDVLGDGSCTYQYIDAGFRCTFATYKLYDDNSVEMNAPTNETVDSTFDESGFISGVAAKGCPQK